MFTITRIYKDSSTDANVKMFSMSWIAERWRFYGSCASDVLPSGSPRCSTLTQLRDNTLILPTTLTSTTALRHTSRPSLGQRVRNLNGGRRFVGRNVFTPRVHCPSENGLSRSAFKHELCRNTRGHLLHRLETNPFGGTALASQRAEHSYCAGFPWLLCATARKCHKIAGTIVVA